MAKVSQAMIAKTLGISQVAVSKALHGRRDISPGVRKKVLDLASHLGYQPNRLARSLVDGKTNTIGVVSPRSRGYYFAALRDALEDELLKLDLFPIILRGGFNDSADKKTLQLFLQYKVDGLIVMSPFEEWQSSFFNELIEDDFPVVFAVKFPNRKACCVLADCLNGTLAAVRYLVGLGHLNIAYLNDESTSIYSVERRVAGYKKGMREINSQERFLGLDSSGSFRTDVLRAVDSGVTAIVCLDDHRALEVVRICEQENIKIPEELSLVGFSNDFHNPEDMKVPLTTIALDPLAKGRMLVERLMNKINGSPVGELMEIKNELIIRKSTAPPRQGS